MTPKNTFRFNITLSYKILILLFLIFRASNAQTLKSEYGQILTLSSLEICSLISFDLSPHSIAASDKNDKIYLSYSGGRLEEVDIKTKSITWRTEIGSEPASKIVLDQPFHQTLYIATESASGSIRAINAETGITKWQVPTQSLSSEEVFLYVFRNTLIVIYKNGKILSLDKNFGILEWTKSLDSSLISKPFFTENQAFFSTTGNIIISMELEKGQISIKYKTSVAPNTLLVNSRGELLWSDKTGKLFSFENLKFRAGAEISYINFNPYGILIASNDNFLYQVSNNKQKILWKKKFAGRIFPQPLVFDKMAIISVMGESELLLIDLENGKKIKSFAVGEKSYFIEDLFIASHKLFFLTTKGLYYSVAFGDGCAKS